MRVCESFPVDAEAEENVSSKAVVQSEPASARTAPPLRDFEFDRNGDISESPVTILEVRQEDTSTPTAGIEGGAVVRVVRPSASLVVPEG